MSFTSGRWFDKSRAAPAGSLRCLLLVLAGALSACGQTLLYQSYQGVARPDSEVAVVRGEQFLRQDIINRFIDGVKFQSVDGVLIEDSLSYRAVALTPGEHELTVFFYWDMGSRRGLATALVNYATTRDSLRRALRFEAEAGTEYIVHAEPVFSSINEDITTLSHVDFWVETSEGQVVVSRESGSYLDGTE